MQLPTQFKNRKHARLVVPVVAIICAVVLSGCVGTTTPATNVGTTSATLNAEASCSGGVPTPCSWYWRWGTDGNYQYSSPIAGPEQVSWSGTMSYTVTGLTPDTTYSYQLCGEGDSISSFECIGSVNGNLSQFTTESSGSSSAPSTTTTTTPSTTTTTTTIPSTTTTTSTSTTTTTTPSSSVAFVQSDDTGTINGNTTSIGSGQSNQVLAQDTGIGHSVVLMIQTLTDPGTETDTVTSVSSGMGTFQFVNSYNDGADTEIWVCPDTTGAADTVTVNTSTNAWDALAVEFNAPATGYVNGGGQVVNLPYLGNQSWTVSPGAAGNVAFVGVDTLDAYVTSPAAPWTSYNSGYWDFPNGTSAAWQVAPSASPLTATWVTDGGESSSQGVVLEY